MGRKRNAGDEWMPPRVYRGKSAYEFRPVSGGAIRLGPIGMKQHIVWKRHEEEMAKLEMKAGSMSELVGEFFDSPAFVALSSASQKKYIKNAKKILTVFGKMSVDKIKPEHIRQYMDKRGKTVKTTANREHSFMSKVFSWGYERGKVKGNPCRGVKKFTEIPRDRYITDEEYNAVLRNADDVVKAVMEISYCCAARVSDVLSLVRDQELPEGLYIKQGKTGKEQIKAWTDRLHRAVELAKSAQETKSFGRIVANTKGQRIPYDTFRNYWRKAKEKALAENPELKLDFTFHDIKAKAITDWTGDKKQFSGHKTDSQVAVYDRKAEVVKTHE